MSLGYRAVYWNSQKIRYDLCLGAGILVYLMVFVGVGVMVDPAATAETLLIRGLGTAALALLHLILSIGPLCRLWPGLLPLLYNRRHMGVSMFLLALAHGLFAWIQFHAWGDQPLAVSLVTSNPRLDSVSQFPFEFFGMAALAILFVMAATSHDFWLKNLSPAVWKKLHMGVYAAYAFLVAHVTLGALQSERSPVLASALAAGICWIGGLHLWSGWRERTIDARQLEAREEFVAVCRVDEIAPDRARIICAGGERIAIFRYDGKISAISNVCAHQNGPLGEGKVVDGCVTCPWHGYQYLPGSGASPPPFEEKVASYRTRVENGLVLLDPRPLPPGTPVEPARESTGSPTGASPETVSGEVSGCERL